MLFKSEVLTQASGSIGGVTYSRNRSGMYRRARSIPVNPNSGNQVEVRAALTELVTRWTSVLTPAQRATWNLYASNVPVINPLGDAITITGQNWYIAANTPRAQAISKLGVAYGLQNTAPTTFDRGDFTTPSFAADVSSGIALTFDNTDDWANEDDSAMLVYEGRPQNASINFFNGPWRLVRSIPGDSVAAPTSPNTITPGELAASGYSYAVGQRVWLTVSVTRNDGRISTRRIIGPELAIA